MISLQYYFGIFLLGLYLLAGPSCSEKLEATIHGETNFIISDQLHFNTGHVASKYFDDLILEAEVKPKTFSIPRTTLKNYPLMFRAALKQESDWRPFRDGKFFLDQNTSKIFIDSLSLISGVDNEWSKEFNEQFRPVFHPNEPESLQNAWAMDDYLYDPGRLTFDSILLDYIKLHPDSYVALWHLIERVALAGYHPFRQTCLQSFSSQLQQSSIGKMLQEELDLIAQLDLGKTFPSQSLRTREGDQKQLIAFKGKVILIDFWFARCRPCLKLFPALQAIYKEYQELGFEIISISTDATEEINRWEQTIDQYNLKWPQYLDENGTIAKKYNIKTFPTTFLLDKNGKIVAKNISLQHLKKELIKMLVNNN